MDVVGFAVELDQFGVQVDAHTAHGALGEGEYGVGEQASPVFGYEDEAAVDTIFATISRERSPPATSSPPRAATC